ncbi:MAG: glycosyltransferase family 4 protein, partial [Candidatus Hydrogenedentes bacterium]|nr:glycosyltransferase family 4 protein [Candidatus Hydrogenedentota bacterium]
FMHRALLFFERLTYRWSDIVFTVNESCRRVVIERGAVPPGRTFVVRNGPDRRNLDEGTPDPALRRGKRHLVAYVGMMGPQDGVDVLIRVVKQLRDDRGRDDFHVRIIGAGTYLPALQAMAADLGVAEYIEFTGRIPHAQVMVELASADVCVCPDPKTPMNDKASLIKVVEYMAKSKPVVAFELNEVMIMAGDAALYAPAGDEEAFTAHLQRLLDDPALREELGRRGRQRVLDGLTWEQSKEHLYAAYDAALGRASVPRAGSGHTHP